MELFYIVFIEEKFINRTLHRLITRGACDLHRRRHKNCVPDSHVPNTRDPGCPSGVTTQKIDVVETPGRPPSSRLYHVTRAQSLIDRIHNLCIKKREERKKGMERLIWPLDNGHPLRTSVSNVAFPLHSGPITRFRRGTPLFSSVQPSPSPRGGIYIWSNVIASRLFSLFLTLIDINRHLCHPDK